VPVRWVLIRDPEGRFATHALRCTDLTAEPAQILAWFVLRWRRAVTFAAVRRHRGVETPRQWSAPAILRTTPAVLGLFSLVARDAQPRMGPPAATVRQAGWSHKTLPTFAEARALTRRERWAPTGFCMSASAPEMVKVPRALLEHMTDALCYAA